MEKKTYKVKEKNTPEQVNRYINATMAASVVFAIGGFVLGAVAYSMGDEVFNNNVIELVAKAAGLGLTTGGISGLRKSIMYKKQLKEYKEHTNNHQLEIIEKRMVAYVNQLTDGQFRKKKEMYFKSYES